jgi:hypothetical protein
VAFCSCCGGPDQVLIGVQNPGPDSVPILGPCPCRTIDVPRTQTTEELARDFLLAKAGRLDGNPTSKVQSLLAAAGLGPPPEAPRPIPLRHRDAFCSRCGGPDKVLIGMQNRGGRLGIPGPGSSPVFGPCPCLTIDVPRTQTTEELARDYLLAKAGRLDGNPTSKVQSLLAAAGLGPPPEAPRPKPQPRRDVNALPTKEERKRDFLAGLRTGPSS